MVRDYDMIRQALGYQTVHFQGDSTLVVHIKVFAESFLMCGCSGSYRAAQYATTFPEHVGHFVLDAVVPRGLVSRTDFIVQSSAAGISTDGYRTLWTRSNTTSSPSIGLSCVSMPFAATMIPAHSMLEAVVRFLP